MDVGLDEAGEGEEGSGKRKSESCHKNNNNKRPRCHIRASVMTDCAKHMSASVRAYLPSEL